MKTITFFECVISHGMTLTQETMDLWLPFNFTDLNHGDISFAVLNFFAPNLWSQ